MELLSEGGKTVPYDWCGSSQESSETHPIPSPTRWGCKVAAVDLVLYPHPVSYREIRGFCPYVSFSDSDKLPAASQQTQEGGLCHDTCFDT
jgi:hypothetical protein